MTRKDYNILARALRESRPDAPITNDNAYGQLVRWNVVVEFIVAELASDNDLFEPDKFRVACGYSALPTVDY